MAFIDIKEYSTTAVLTDTENLNNLLETNNKGNHRNQTSTWRLYSALYFLF